MILRTLIIGLLSILPSLALAQNAESTQELLDLADAYYTRGSCELAQLIFQQALEREPENVEAMLGKGKALVCQGAFDLGIQEYQKIIANDPNNVTAHVQLARAFERQHGSDSQRYPNRLVDALEIIQTAERLDDSSAEVFNTKGVILYGSGDFEGARAAFERATSLVSEDQFSAKDRAAMQVNLGKTYRQLGELALAETAFRRAVTLDPTSAEAHSELGNVHYRLGDCEGAQFELSQAANLDPSSLSAVAQLAITLFECGDVEGSIPRLQQAIQLGGVNIPALYTYLARAYLQQGRLNEAATEAQKGALLPPVTAEGFYWLGQAYQARGEAGDTEKARSAYERALEIDPNYPSARDALNTLP